MATCLICETPIEPFINFGRMPIANGFLTPDQFADEYFFELKVAHCPRCSMVQLTEHVDRERMFHENYAFFSSTSAWMQRHFASFADFVQQNWITDADPFVAEIGSNDGIMLKHFASRGIRHLGIEPSANVAEVARSRGVNTTTEFFDEDLARRILDEHGPADAFLGANVMCHIPYMHSVVAGIRLLLKPKGVLIFEDPFLGDIIERTSYDQIYDEHAFYFSLSSLSHLFAMHDMEIVDALPQEVHGGSMRWVVAKKGAHPVRDSVRALAEREASLGLATAECFERFRANVERSRDELVSLLTRVRDEGKRVVGYAATSKSTTVTNYCGIGPDLVEFISDTTPIKQGKFSPGTHIPVRPHEDFAARYPEYALLFGWNHRNEIVAKEQAFRDAGGKWIVYVPRVEVVA
ncbi:MAG TPA: class I SAM-dependent methyltransferase [Thermoanaerobaculia bacterium]|nr:class I SAM-dependent methyltransferase [Thermoanaerobaculia bacterium]